MSEQGGRLKEKEIQKWAYEVCEGINENQKQPRDSKKK